MPFVLSDEPQESPKGRFSLSEEPEGELVSDADLFRDIPKGIPLRGSKNILKSIASEASFGLSEKIPGFKPEEGPESAVGRGIGMILPVGGALKLGSKAVKPLVKLAQKSPFLAKPLKYIANLLGVGVAGAGHKAVEELAHGNVPSAKEVAEHGAEWAALDAGLGALGASAKFTKSLLARSKATGKEPWKIINEVYTQAKSSGIDVSQPERVAAKALSILEEPVQATKSLDLTKSKIEPKINQLEKSDKLFEKAELPKKSTFKSQADDLVQTGIDKKLEEIAPRSPNEEVFGQTIKQDVEKQLTEAKKIYEPLYEQAQKAAKDIKYVPASSANATLSAIRKIDKINFTPEGYKTVRNQMDTILKDLGYDLIHDERGNIKGISQPKKATNIDELMELGRRLNEAINYEAIDKSVRDRLRPIARSVKEDIRKGLGNANPRARQAFERAENEFGATAQKFGKDSVRNIRKLEATEKIAKLVQSPSSIGDLKQVLSKEQFRQLERQLLDEVSSMSHPKASSFVRQVEHRLSPEAQSLAKEIVESKSPKPKPTKFESLKSGVIDDLSTSLANGKRPEKTLDLWKTKEGRKVVGESLRGNPNKEKIVDYLKKTSFQDSVSTFIGKDGKVSWKKFDEFIKDPNVIQQIKDISGDAGVNFIRDLKNLSSSLDKNLKLLEKLSPIQTTGEIGNQTLKRMARKDFPLKFKVEDIMDALGVPGQTVLHLLGVWQFGLLKYPISALTTRYFYKMATSPNARNAFIRASKAAGNSSKRGRQVIRYLKEFDKAMDEK